MDKITDFDFDAIYLINLKRKPAKLAWALNELAEIGISPIVFEAVDAFEMGLSTTKIGKEGNTGAVGCLLSHQGCLRDALMNGFEKILIFEDDIIKPDKTANQVTPNTNFGYKTYSEIAPHFIAEVSQMNPDIILWGWNVKVTQPKKITEFVSVPQKSIYGSQAISYHTPEIIKRVFEFTRRMDHFDLLVDYLTQENGVRAFMPCQTLFDQVRSFSDIWPNSVKDKFGRWYDVKFRAFCRERGLTP